MNRWTLLTFATVLLAFPSTCPAPLIYTPGEGWHYEPAGGEGSWRRGRAKDQLEVAQTAFDNKDFSTALRASKHLVTQWPFSDYAPQGQYLLARCYEEKAQDERAFKAYQHLIEHYPKISNYDEIVKRQKIIADRFLNGQWFKLLNYIPFFPSMDKTIKMYDQIVKNGPYSEVAPAAQLNIGEAHERKAFEDLTAAARAYERAADRYNDRPAGTDALYRVGLVYQRQARSAEYDQSIAGQAISTFSDFATLHPEDARIPETQKIIGTLKTEQARGSYEIARYYERHHKWEGAKIYYNDVIQKDASSIYAETALRRIEAINQRARK